MDGLHLTADLADCRGSPRWLTEPESLVAACAQAVHASGLHTVAQLAPLVPATPAGPGGVTATVLLAESHLCVHTWPERRGVTLDVYVCNFSGDNSARARALFDETIAAFAPGTVEKKEVARGHLTPERISP